MTVSNAAFQWNLFLPLFMHACIPSGKQLSIQYVDLAGYTNPFQFPLCKNGDWTHFQLLAWLDYLFKGGIAIPSLTLPINSVDYMLCFARPLATMQPQHPVLGLHGKGQAKPDYSPGRSRILTTPVHCIKLILVSNCSSLDLGLVYFSVHSVDDSADKKISPTD